MTDNQVQGSRAKPIIAGWTPLGLKWLQDGAPFGERYLKWRKAQNDNTSPVSWTESIWEGR